MEKNKISLDDLRHKAAQINQAVARDIKSRKVELWAGAAAVVAAAICLSYFYGKRRGRRR